MGGGLTASQYAITTPKILEVNSIEIICPREE
jgi:hypothetical protein